MAIQHIVCFKFKEDVEPSDINRHMEMFAALPKIIPGVLAYSAGKTFGVDYESTGNYDCMHCLKCESEEALENYFHHEAHQKFNASNQHLWQDVLVVNAQEE